MLRCGGSAGHLRDRATSHRSCLAPPASHPTPRLLCPGLLHVQGHRVRRGGVRHPLQAPPYDEGGQGGEHRHWDHQHVVQNGASRRQGPRASIGSSRYGEAANCGTLACLALNTPPPSVTSASSYVRVWGGRGFATCFAGERHLTGFDRRIREWKMGNQGSGARNRSIRGDASVAGEPS